MGRDLSVTLDNCEGIVAACCSPQASHQPRGLTMSRLHLPDLERRRFTICGLPVSAVILGGYQIDLDEEDQRYVESVFLDGHPGDACSDCLVGQLVLFVPASISQVAE